MYSARGPDRGHHEPHGQPAPADLAGLVLAVSRRLRRRWADGLAPWGLSPHQGRALRAVSHGERLRLGDLAAELRIAPRSATEVVDGLAELGLVVRVPDPSDRRATYVEVTEVGRRTNAEITATRDADAETVFAHLAGPDREALERILRDIVDAADTPR